MLLVLITQEGSVIVLLCFLGNGGGSNFDNLLDKSQGSGMSVLNLSQFAADRLSPKNFK